MTPDRFHLSALPRGDDGTHYVVFRRDGAKPAGGTASGPTPDRAREAAMATVGELLAWERAREGRR